MAHALLNPEDVEGWRGVIEDGEVVKDHETVLEEEARERGEEPTETADADEAGAVDDAVEEEPADDTEREADDEGPDEEVVDEDDARADEDMDADGERSGGRRRAPARSGSRGRAPARAR